jgi:hypothetical protein
MVQAELELEFESRDMNASHEAGSARTRVNVALHWKGLFFATSKYLTYCSFFPYPYPYP